jgi:hypothetical protein
MASKAPPIPPEQRSSPGDKPHIQGKGGRDRDIASNTKEQGHAGNIHQNTHHQGHQQDR